MTNIAKLLEDKLIKQLLSLKIKNKSKFTHHLIDDVIEELILSSSEIKPKFIMHFPVIKNLWKK